MASTPQAMPTSMAPAAIRLATKLLACWDEQYVLVVEASSGSTRRINAVRARERYALNYCTFNYTMSFYSWDDRQHELDWMALSGVNLMLVANGEEAVWRNTLQRLQYSDEEISRFIPGPAYTAWWLMGNLEGVGGPMSNAMIERRSEMQARMITRMHSLGIEPVLPGFYGMVPASLGQKLKAHIVDQGKWSGFHRPGILDPTDPEFARVAGIYYEELKKLYGPDIHFFSGDPFHEGGVMAGVDLGRSGVAIQSAMQDHFPGSTWVLQGWIENPRKELIAATDKSHVLVQELFGEQTRNWEIRGAYEGTPFVWCCIDNFGERPGLYGRLQHYSDEVHRARTGDLGRYVQGTGIMPEGIDNNPVAYDLVLELAWHSDHVDAAQWLEGYVAYRYGRTDPDISGRVGSPAKDRLRRRGRRHTGKRTLFASVDARHGAQPLGRRRAALRPGRVRAGGQSFRAGGRALQGQRNLPPRPRVVPSPGPLQRGPRRVPRGRRRAEAKGPRRL